MSNLILDTSILLGISHIYQENIVKPRSRRERELFIIKDLLEDKKINCIVTPTIMREVKRGWRRDDGFAERVVNRFCEIVKFDEYSEGKALSITDAYGNFPIGDFPAIVNAEDYLQQNYNDAAIIAEVAIEQKRRGMLIPFVTDNIRDVCDEAKINQINSRHNVPKVHIHSMSTLKDAIELAKNSNPTM